MAKKKKAASKKVAKPKQAKRASRATVKPVSNGLKMFAMHQSDSKAAPMMRAVRTTPTASLAAAAVGADFNQQLDPETVAQRYLENALQSTAVRGISAPKGQEAESEFKSLGTETIPLTKSRVVKFRQTLNKIPVYGSLVSVELDDSNDLIGINSAIGEPKGVNSVAKVSPADAIKAVKEFPGFTKQLKETVPRLNFYFDQKTQKWRLVYILEDVPVRSEKQKKKSGDSLSGDSFPYYMDYIVDAHTGKVVVELPRTPTMAVSTTTGKDALNTTRTFTVETNGSTAVLKNTALNVQTFDFTFRDPEVQSSKLPGAAIKNPPAFTPTAVSAHANAEVTAQFLRTVLLRNNIDNHGGPMNSSINCVAASDSPGPKQWGNAFWDGNQMVYGQILLGGSLVSFCTRLDVVVHEMFHGVTDMTSRLEYASQPGALNESFSDVFGVIVANFSNPDPRTWNWNIGDGLDNGQPLRDMSNPTRFGQPDKMANYRNLPVTRFGDWGGVHTNSGIPNKAAFNILVAQSSGSFVFTVQEVTIMYYYALTQLLSRTSQFIDTRNAVIQSARTLFRSLAAPELAKKVNAIEKSFDSVGIV